MYVYVHTHTHTHTHTHYARFLQGGSEAPSSLSAYSRTYETRALYKASLRGRTGEVLMQHLLETKVPSLCVLHCPSSLFPASCCEPSAPPSSAVALAASANQIEAYKD